MGRFSRFLFAAFLIASTLCLGDRAAAGAEWCAEDPEFLVNGGLVDVSTLFKADPARVKSVHFDLQVPSNAVALAVSLPGTVTPTASISRTLSPYYGIGWMPVVVTVTVNSYDSFATTTTITGTQGQLVSSVPGKSNYSTKIKFSMLALSLL